MLQAGHTRRHVVDALDHEYQPLAKMILDLPNTRLWRDDPRPMASSPLIVVPTASSGPSCSKLSRCGLAKPEYAARLGRRPTLTAPARAGFAILRVGAKKRDSKSNKETGMKEVENAEK